MSSRQKTRRISPTSTAITPIVSSPSPSVMSATPRTYTPSTPTRPARRSYGSRVAHPIVTTTDVSPQSDYVKLANVEQGRGMQKVLVYVPDTRRPRSPAAEMRATEKMRLREQLRTDALQEELRTMKRQRNQLANNLASARTRSTPRTSNRSICCCSPTVIASPSR